MSIGHLHLHTEFSVLDGMSSIDSLVSKSKDLGFNAIAITDHRNLYGVVEFAKSCKKHGMKGLIGCEIEETEDRLLHDNEARKVRGHDNYHLILIAKNSIGYQNLIEIVSDAATEGFYFKERTDLSVLKQKGEGLIALSACLGGRIPQLILNGKYEEAKQVALDFNNIFEHFYLELMANDSPEQQIVNMNLVNISKDTGIPIVITKDVHYLDQEDADIHDTVLCVQTKSLKSDPDRYRFDGDYYYLCSPEHLQDWLSAAQLPPEAITNIGEIIDMCDFELPLGGVLMPHFETPMHIGEEDYLRQLCIENLIKLAEKEHIDIKTYVDRLHEELHVICTKQFAGYFLVLWDIINFARQQGIVIGPGRGSAAGCLISYLLQITRLDPIKHGLLFARFLNPERNSPPDIDIDIERDRREEIIDYVQNKYGKENVAQIITFGRMGARIVIKDVMRALGYTFEEANEITKNVPDKMPDQSEVSYERLMDMADNPDNYDFGGKSSSIFKVSQEIRDQLQYYPDVKKALDKMAGMIRHVGIHAAGVVITPGKITNFMPVRRGSASATLQVAQWDKDYLEDIGALKIDLLGLKFITIISNAQKLAGVKEDLNDLLSDFDDPEVYKLLQRGETHGVFQVSSHGMTHLLGQVVPDKFDDIVDTIASFRPGPLDAKMDNGMTMVEQYIKNKHNPMHISYEHPDLKSILESSHGVILYQESVMEIARKIGGYTLGGSDTFRRVVGKKKIEEIKAMRHEFVYGVKEDGSTADNVGAINLGYTEEFAHHIYDQLVKFAGYSFNRSHSAGYAVMTYQTAWLKCHYPVEYMTALLSANADNKDAIVQDISECKRIGIDILPPSVNRPSSDFIIEKDDDDKKSIRFSLKSVIGLGDKAVDEIIKVAPFTSIKDFYDRINKRIVNKRAVAALIKAGCFDFENPDRHHIMRKYFTLRGEQADNEYLMPFDDEKKLQYEKDQLGMYVTGHPLEKLPFTRWSEILSGAQVELSGIIRKIKEHTDKKGKTMLFMDIETQEDTRSVVAFATLYPSVRKICVKDNIIVVAGTKDGRKDSFIAQNIMSAEDYLLGTTNKVVLTTPVNKKHDLLQDLFE